MVFYVYNNYVLYLFSFIRVSWRFYELVVFSVDLFKLSGEVFIVGFFCLFGLDYRLFFECRFGEDEFLVVIIIE